MKLYNKILELREEISSLKREAEYKEKEWEVREQKIRLDEKEKRLDVETEFIKCQAANEQIIKRMDEHPYQLVSDMLKALVVKFPTLNIKDLAIKTGR
ncbi:MAG: hypothetical protein V3V81_08005 [Candidatus Bathyarchaeia archaeon]